MPAESENVIHQLAVGGDAAIAEIIERAYTSDDVTTVVAAALFTPADNDYLMERAATLAATTRDRQLVAIAIAHLEGNADRVQDLARDHLVDHPDSVLVAWITSESNHATRTPRGPIMSTVSTTRPAVTSSTDDRRARYSRRPWWRWLLTALAFPPAGYIAHVVAGRVDSVSAAVLNGVIAGAGIGAAQWALLRHRGVSLTWIPATAVGLGAGLAAGAALVSYRTDITSLALMGAVSGFAVGVAQGATLGHAGRTLAWSAATAALWALGWTVTTAAGIDVSQQWAVFGAAGCFTLAFLQSIIIGAFVPAKAVTP